MANPSKGLGRGLAALLGDDVMTPEEEKTSLYLPISQVESCASQPRKQFDPDALADLADSIREHGIIQPLTVRKLQSGYYQIIAGERRWRAARMAGLSEVPAIVIEADDRKAMELAMIENLQREDLNPMEEAEGYQTLMQQYNMTQEETAQRVGKSRSTVANAIIKDELSVRQTEQLVKKLTAPPKPEQPEPDGLSVDYAKEAAKELGSRLGRGCRIVTGRKKGRIELEYYGVEDLNQLLDALHALKAK